MPGLPLDKHYREAAEEMAALMPDAIITPYDKTAGVLTIHCIDVEGMFEVFSIQHMGPWGGHIKFTFRDTDVKEENEIELRGTIAMYNPMLAGLMTARAQLTVQKRLDVVVKKTITSERYINGHKVGSATTETVEEQDYQWVDVTSEFARACDYEQLMRERSWKGAQE